MSSDSYASDFNAIESVLGHYFDGLYSADIAKLEGIFHVEASLQAPGIRRSRSEWLNLVANRPIPKMEGEAYRFKILAIEIVGVQAMAKVECPLFKNFYIDFLGLLKEDGDWKIVNKMYCEIP